MSEVRDFLESWRKELVAKRALMPRKDDPLPPEQPKVEEHLVRRILAGVPDPRHSLSAAYSTISACYSMAPGAIHWYEF